MRHTFTAPTRKGLGTTLIEVTVASALISIIFIGVFLIVDKGMRFYRLNSDANDRQRGVLMFLSKLNQAMQNTQPALIFVDSPAPAPATGAHTYSNSRGLAYAIPFNEKGQAEFDPTSRQLFWQGYGCFFLKPNGELRWIATYMSGLTSPNAKTIAPPTPDTTVPAMIPATFVGGSQGKLLARDVTALTFKRHEAGETLPNGRPSLRRFYDVEVECGRRNDPQGYWIKLVTSFYPRN